MEGRERAGHDPEASLREIRRILVGRGLLEPGEDLASGMLEDLVHYAYFTSCITKADVRRLLGLSPQGARERIRSWKRWHEGNRSCQLRQNPFYEAWPAEGDPASRESPGQERTKGPGAGERRERKP